MVLMARTTTTAAAATTGLSLIILLLLFSIIITPSSSVFAQTNYYENPADGFRVQVPDGWVIDDIDNTDPDVIANEEVWNA
jgi:hypothetical protein